MGRAVVGLLATGEYQERAARLGKVLEDGLESLVGRGVERVRVRGLWAGVDMDPSVASGREVCERLLAEGVLAKDTHGATIRLAPPLVVEESEVELLVDTLGRVLR